jgi:hypothetical protein
MQVVHRSAKMPADWRTSEGTRTNHGCCRTTCGAYCSHFGEVESADVNVLCRTSQLRTAVCKRLLRQAPRISWRVIGRAAALDVAMYGPAEHLSVLGPKTLRGEKLGAADSPQ